MRHLISSFLLIFCLSSGVAAQAIVTNPTKITFTASADHTTVTSYSVTTYRIDTGGSVLAFTQTLGKPAPDGTNTITVLLSTIPQFAALTQGNVYSANVGAVGPTGTGVSAASNPFVFASAPPRPVTNVLIQ